MFYTWKVLALNNPLIKRVLRKINALIPHRDLPDNVSLVRTYAPEKSFADIGCLWGVNGLNSFIAEEVGATRVMAVDVYPESKEFLEDKEKRNSKVTFVQGDINLLETTEKIGICDIVLCSGVLYHTPDPVHLLTRLRSICKETLILNTASIPEMHGVSNGAIFYPFLNKEQRKIWNRGIGSQKAITGAYEPESGYGNWFWGLTPSSLESMLNCAGFEVKERYISPFHSVFICSTAPIKFVASSGEWTTPKSGDSLKFRR
ncbi:MAG: class I SAM-dependent methyltransferase [Patescibacteria group bacterium]